MPGPKKETGLRSLVVGDALGPAAELRALQLGDGVRELLIEARDDRNALSELSALCTLGQILHSAGSSNSKER